MRLFWQAFQATRDFCKSLLILKEFINRYTMKKVILAAGFAATLVFAGCEGKGGSTIGNGVDTTKTDTVVAHVPVAPKYNSPEGAVSDGEYLYVSNLGVERAPSVKDGDGRIMKLNMEANDWLDKDKWSAIKLDAPKGMGVIGRTLYVTDIDRVVAIDLDKVEQIGVVDFSGTKTSFLNDIAVMNDSTLLVSATDLNAIFKVNVHAMTFEKMKTGKLNGPNGLVYSSEDGKIYCAEYGSKANAAGRILTIDINSGAIKQIGEHTGGLDGLALNADGGLLFTDWNIAHLAKADKDNGGAVTELSDSIQGPADFYFEVKTKRKFVPAMLEDTLYIVTAE